MHMSTTSLDQRLVDDVTATIFQATHDPTTGTLRDFNSGEIAEAVVQIVRASENKG
jgi:hypothetical protein